MEKWKPIDGFEGFYEVSDKGRVRSVSRTIRQSNGTERTKKSHVLAQTAHYRNGYLSVMLSKEGCKKRVSVHRLVASAFVPNDKHLPEVNHKDETKTNNSAENLEWCDRRYNNTYGTVRDRIAKTQGCAVAQMDRNGNVIATFHSQGAAARATGAAQSGISACLLGKDKTSGGFLWGHLL